MLARRVDDKKLGLIIPIIIQITWCRLSDYRPGVMVGAILCAKRYGWLYGILPRDMHVFGPVRTDYEWDVFYR